MNQRIAIQGYTGSFHDEVCNQYFGRDVDSIPADAFDILGQILTSRSVDRAVMAIKNSIARTILQNYRILSEAVFWVLGKQYLRIRLNTLVFPGTTIDLIKEVHYHPMAFNQCLKYLRQYPYVKMVETEDTALSALRVMEDKRTDLASMSSAKTAELYGLETLGTGIETNKHLYTRFFILSKDASEVSSDAYKVSIYVRIPDIKGQLLKVLRVIDDYDLNMSKLQSFSVFGKMREYFFHLDIELDTISQYQNLKVDLLNVTFEYIELGIYKRDNIHKLITN